MKLLDKMQNIEQIRNINSRIAPRFCPFGANFRRTFTRPAKRRSYVLFHNLFYDARRLQRRFAHGSFITLQPDIEKYLPFFDEFDLTKEQKIEYIHTMWKITGAFSYRAFGLDSAQLAFNDKNKKVDAKTKALLESKDQSLSAAFEYPQIDMD